MPTVPRKLVSGIALALCAATGPAGTQEPEIRKALPLDPNPPAGEEVEVKLNRPFEPGQVFSYASVGRTYRQTIVSTEGAVVSDRVRGLRCELAAALGVEAVRADGRPRELSLRVFRLVVRDGFLPPEEGGAVDAGEEPLEAGVELKVVYPEQGPGAPEILPAAGDGELAPEVADALRLVLPAPSGTRDDDLLFGIGRPVAVGERWAVDREAVALALLEGGVEVAPDKLEGSAFLASRDPVSGGYEVEVELLGDRAGVPLPEGYATRSGRLHALLNTRLPAAPGEPLEAESAEYSLRSRALGKEGERLMMVDVNLFQSRKARYRRVGDDR